MYRSQIRATDAKPACIVGIESEKQILVKIVDCSPANGGYVKTIEFFLASSDELVDDRIAIGDFFGTLNDINNQQETGLYFHLQKWERGSGAITQAPKQDEYNDMIRKSQLCFFLFATKYGPWTAQEFDVALEQFKSTNTPEIIVWFKELDDNETMSDGLVAFQHRLDKDLKHFWDAYRTIDSVKLGILVEIKRRGIDIGLGVKEENVTVFDQPIIDLTKVPSYQGSEKIQVLKDRLDYLGKEQELLHSRIQADPDDSNLLAAYQELSKRLQDLQNDFAQEQARFITTIFENSLRTASGELVSPRQKLAYRLYDLGKIAQVRQVLSLEELAKDTEQRQRQSHLVHQVLQEAVRATMQVSINEYIQFADLAAALPREEEDALNAAAAIEKEHDLGDYAQMRLAGFYVDHGQYADALRILNVIFGGEQSQSDNDAEAVAYLLLLFARAYDEGHDLYSSKDPLGLSLVIRCLKSAISLIPHNPPGPNLRSALISLTSALWASGQEHEGKAVFEEALQAISRLTDPEELAFSMSVALNMAGGHYCDTEQLPNAVECLTDALSQLDNYNDEKSSALKGQIWRNLGNTYNSIAIDYQDSGWFANAEDAEWNSYDLLSNLYSVNPVEYGFAFARTLVSLGRVHANRLVLDFAEEELTQAVDILRDLFQQEPLAYRFHLSRALYLLAYVAQSRSCTPDHLVALLSEAKTVDSWSDDNISIGPPPVVPYDPDENTSPLPNNQSDDITHTVPKEPENPTQESIRKPSAVPLEPKYAIAHSDILRDALTFSLENALGRKIPFTVRDFLFDHGITEGVCSEAAESQMRTWIQYSADELISFPPDDAYTLMYFLDVATVVPDWLTTLDNLISSDIMTSDVMAKLEKTHDARTYRSDQSRWASDWVRVAYQFMQPEFYENSGKRLFFDATSPTGFALSYKDGSIVLVMWVQGHGPEIDFIAPPRPNHVK